MFFTAVAAYLLQEPRPGHPPVGNSTSAHPRDGETWWGVFRSTARMAACVGRSKVHMFLLSMQMSSDSMVAAPWGLSGGGAQG